ncbi:MAG: hypothetical protein ACD_2C00052G0002 [uncultured bacterium (gcode 4)]|uniref:PQ loop repeat n=1 Tax=uncultured bacterium (gcode 4) TaxID=1234023 RepID=K2FFW0_9BACT|nr:MAG: hypothetical protein ACD_2C00052G0002 [uncultured bacterium (gcode 4)]
MTPTDIIWYLATAVWTLLMLPQLVKSFKSKSMKDVSWWMVLMYVLNCFLWLVYWYLIKSFPLMLCNFIALIIWLLQFWLKIRYEKMNKANIT